MVGIKEYDQEWFDLIAEAKKIGLSTQEIREFINRSKKKEQKLDSANLGIYYQTLLPDVKTDKGVLNKELECESLEKRMTRIEIKLDLLLKLRNHMMKVGI